MGEAARIWTTVGANIAPLKAGLAEASAATKTFGRSFGGAMASHTAQMEKFGRSMRRNISMPLIATGAVAAKMALDFQRNMAMISTSAGASAKDVKLLTGEVLKLAQSGNSPYGPNELAKSLYHLKSLGYDNATAMRTMRVAINGAMAGNSDLESTTSALGAAIRTNIKGTFDFSKAMGTLNAIVGAGNMRMDDLIAALGTGVLPAAKTAGLSLKDVGAALALMVDEGMHADAAATRLRMSFSLMAAPSKAADKALSRIGLSGSQLGMAMQGPGGLVHALTILQTHLADLGDSDKIKKWAAQVHTGKMSLEEFQKLAGKTAEFDVLSKAFGGGRSAGAIELLLNNLDVLRQKYQQITDTAGNFADKVKQARDLDINKIKSSWSQVEASLIRAGAAITPFVVKAAKGLATLSTWFSNLHDGTRKWLMVAGTAMALGGPMLIFTAKLITALKVMKGLFFIEQTASTIATGTVAANMATQAAAAETATGAVLSLQAALMGIAALGVISATIVIYELLKDRGKYNYTDVGSTGSGGVNQRYVVDKDGNYHVTNRTGLRGSRPTYSRGATAGEVNGATGLYTSGSGGSAGANDSPGRSYMIAASSKKRAQDLQRQMRDALQAKADASFKKLMKDAYGSTDYVPPPLPDLGGGKGSKVKHGKAKPVTNPIVAAAAEYMGVPYVWGGSSPAGFDCSGFVQYLYKKVGIDLPRTSQQQARVGKGVSLGMLKPGDLVFTNKHADGPHHEGVYIGKGMVAEAHGDQRDSAGHTLPGHQVKKVSLASFGAYEARRVANLSGSYGGHFTNATSYVKLAAPGDIAKQAAIFKAMMREIDGLTGDEKTKAVASMKKIGKALVQVLTPGDLSSVKGKLATMQKVLAVAVDHMKTVVDSKKQAFQAAWERLAAAGTSALDKRLGAELARIAAKYASGPDQSALSTFERQKQLDQLNQDLGDANDQYQQALAGGDPAAIKDAARAVKQAQDAITEDQLQQKSDAEQKANEQSQKDDEDAANAKYDRLKQSFEDQVGAIENGMADGSIATSTGLDEIKGLFVQFGIDLGSTGPVIAGTIYSTITAGLEGATAAANELADALRTLNLLTDTNTTPIANNGSSGAAGYFALNPLSSSTGKPKAFANGGIVRHRPGGILATIGEGSQDEGVFPLSAMHDIGGPSQINLTVQSVIDGQVVAESTHKHLLRKKRRVGSLGLSDS